MDSLVKDYKIVVAFSDSFIKVNCSYIASYVYVGDYYEAGRELEYFNVAGLFYESISKTS